MNLADADLTTLDYPEPDVVPAAETELHGDLQVSLIHALSQHFKDDDAVYVGGSLLLYYDESYPLRSYVADISLVRGVAKHRRRTYKVWEEGKAPDVMIELTSKVTRIEDGGEKKALYEFLEVQEYFLFDPHGEYLDPPFQGFCLKEGEYVRMESSGGRLRSEAIGLDLAVVDGRLRLIDPGTDKLLPLPDEAEKARYRAEEAEHEAERAERAAEEVRRRAEEARRRAEEAWRLAEEAAAKLAEENERLRAELERRKAED